MPTKEPLLLRLIQSNTAQHDRKSRFCHLPVTYDSLTSRLLVALVLTADITIYEVTPTLIPLRHLLAPKTFPKQTSHHYSKPCRYQMRHCALREVATATPSATASIYPPEMSGHYTL